MSYIFREHIKQSLAVIAFLLTLTACTSESYDAGDGPNSYLTADLVLLHTSQDKSVRSALLAMAPRCSSPTRSRRTGSHAPTLSTAPCSITTRR